MLQVLYITADKLTGNRKNPDFFLREVRAWQGKTLGCEASIFLQILVLASKLSWSFITVVLV